MKTDYEFIIDIDKPMERQRSKWTDIPLVLEQALEDALLDFNEQLYDKLVENMLIYGVYDMALADTIDIQTTVDGISIRMDSDYAVFIEYGTGFNGATDPHPMANSHGWMYMSGEASGRGIGGWFYPTVDSDPNPYKHLYNGQLYGWTRGLPSRPFMYETWLWGVRSINNIINGHINRAMKRMGAR